MAGLPNTTPLQLGLPRLITRAVLSAANTGRDGTGTIVDVATFVGTAAIPPNGGQVRTARVVATGTTTAGMLRTYIHDGTQYVCIQEDAVSAIVPSATVKAFTVTITLNRDFPPNTKLAMSTHNAETFHVIADIADY